MSSLVSLANDIFASDLNELQQYRDQLEVRSDAQQKLAERQEYLKKKQQEQATAEQERLDKEKAESEAALNSAGAGGGGGGRHHNTRQQQQQQQQQKSSTQKQQSSARSRRSGAGGDRRPGSARSRATTNDEEGGDEEGEQIPPRVAFPITDLSGVVDNSRIDPFLAAVQALDSHAASVAESNAPYQAWMKQRMNFLKSRSHLVGNAPIPEDVMGDDENEAEIQGGKLEPPPLAIPLLAFTRDHTNELKKKFSYAPPRGLLTAGKVSEEEAEKLKQNIEDEPLKKQLETHNAGETWKDPDALPKSHPRHHHNKKVKLDSSSSSSAVGGGGGRAGSTVLSSSSSTTSRSLKRVNSGGSGGRFSSSVSEVGTSDDATTTFGGGTISDYTEMYLQESGGAVKRREARQRDQDRFHAKMRSAIEFSSKKLEFYNCLPSQTYKQTFRLWNRSNELRRFKITPGSNQALKKSRVAGQSFEPSWGKSINDKKENEQEGEEEEKQQQQHDYETDGNEAYDIPQLSCRVLSPSNYSPDKALAPGTSIVIEVTVKPHWSAFESADCHIAVVHCRDVNSHVREKNDLSQWHCEELPVFVGMLKPQLKFTSLFHSSSHNVNCIQAYAGNRLEEEQELQKSPTTPKLTFAMPTCFIGNSVEERILVENTGSRASFSLRVEPRVNPFTISPTFFDLNKNETSELVIKYTPRDDAANILKKGSHFDEAILSFEGSLLPHDDDNTNDDDDDENDGNHQASSGGDTVSRLKGRRRVIKEYVAITGTGTDACVYVSTIGASNANQLAMKKHRGANSVGNVNINDAVVGFTAWRPITLTNDSDLDVPVLLQSGCIPSSPTASTSNEQQRVASLSFNRQQQENNNNNNNNVVIVPAHETKTVELYLTTHKSLFHDSTFLNKNKEQVFGRFFISVISSSIPEIAVQRAHERRFASLKTLPQRKPRTDPNSYSQQQQQQKNEGEEEVHVPLSHMFPTQQEQQQKQKQQQQEEEGEKNDNIFFVEEFDVTSKPSKPALSFTPTHLDMTDVEALTNQTNICDAILRNDGAGELVFYFIDPKQSEGIRNSGFSAKKMQKIAVAQRRQKVALLKEKDLDEITSSDDDDDDDDNNNNDNNSSSSSSSSALSRERILAANQVQGSKLLKECGVEVGHGYHEDGGIEWWTVPSCGSIAPGQELRVSVRYCLRRAGSTKATIQAFSPLLVEKPSSEGSGDNNNNSSSTLPPPPLLTVTAKGRGPTIQANVTSLEFGSVTYGAESETRFSLFNPTENAVYVSVCDGHVNDSLSKRKQEQQQQQQEGEGEGEEDPLELTASRITSFAEAKTKRLVIAPSHCTLHPRQSAIVTVYLRAVHPGKNEDFVRVKVEDGTDLLIPFNGEVVVPELVATPSTLLLGRVDRDVVIPCSLTLSNPSCIAIPFEVVEVDRLQDVCSIDLIGCQSMIPAGALDVPVNFTVTFDLTKKDVPVTVAFAFLSSVLASPVLVQIQAECVCQPTVALAVTLPGQPLFCQSTEGFVGAILRNIVDDALELVQYQQQKQQEQEQEQEQEGGVDTGNGENSTRTTRLVAPFVDPIVLNGTIDMTLPYCAQDFELLIKNPTGCVFPCSTSSVRYPASNRVIAEAAALLSPSSSSSGGVLVPAPPPSNTNNNNNNTATAAASGGGNNQQQQQLLQSSSSSSSSSTARATGRSTRLPKMPQQQNQEHHGFDNTAGTSRTNKSTGGGTNKTTLALIPPLESQTAGRTFFCRSEDGTDMRDRAREHLLAVAASLVQTGREVAIDIISKDEEKPQVLDCVLRGHEVHPLSVRCLATIPGVFQDKLRLDFGTGVPSTELPVTFRVSGTPVVVDPSTSAMVLDPVAGIATLQLPSVVAGTRSVKRVIQITSRCPRDLRLDCRITVTGSSVGSALLPAEIYGGESPVSTALFSKEGGPGGGGGAGGATTMERSWASVSPSNLTLGALQSTQLTIEYKPPADAQKMSSWEGVLHISSTIVPSAFNDKFLISEFYEMHQEEFPCERSLNPVAIGHNSAATPTASSQIKVKGVSKLPLRVPVIKRPGVIENGQLLHRAAAHIVAQEESSSVSSSGNNNNNNNNNQNGDDRKEKSAFLSDSSDDDGDDDDQKSEKQQNSSNNKKKKNNEKQKKKEEEEERRQKTHVDEREERRALIAKVKKERPSSASNLVKTGRTFDAHSHELCVRETVMILHHLRRRYQELSQFTAGGFVLPTQLNLRVRHIHPVLDIDPFPLVRFPKCFVPELPPDLKHKYDQLASSSSGSSLTPQPTSNAMINLATNATAAAAAAGGGGGGSVSPVMSVLSADALQTATQTKHITPLPNNQSSVRLQNNGVTGIDARLYLGKESSVFYKVVGFTRKHSDSRPKRAANKYETSPVESGSTDEHGNWLSAQFHMVPQEIIDINVALVNAHGPQLEKTITRFSKPRKSKNKNNNAKDSSCSSSSDDEEEMKKNKIVVRDLMEGKGVTNKNARLDKGGASPFATVPGILELRFSNGEIQKINLSSHVYVPRIFLVESDIEFQPTVEVSLGRGQSTLSRRITLVNASPCSAAFEIIPIIKQKKYYQQQVVVGGEGEEEEGKEREHLLANAQGGARHNVARSAALALSQKQHPAAGVALLKKQEQEQKQQQTSKNANSNNTASNNTKSPVRRRDITLKAAANSVDLRLKKQREDYEEERSDSEKIEDDDDHDDDDAIYDTGRFQFSQQRGHVDAASSAGIGSKIEIDVSFEPFASALFEAQFQIRVDGGVGDVLNIVAQSRVTEV